MQFKAKKSNERITRIAKLKVYFRFILLITLSPLSYIIPFGIKL